MIKDPRGFIMNHALNRWKINSKKNMGYVSHEIQKYMPKSLDEWAEYYYKNVRTKGHLEMLGIKLKMYITTEMPKDIMFNNEFLRGFTEQECCQYTHDLPILKTFQGYSAERGVIVNHKELDFRHAPPEIEGYPYYVDIWALFNGYRVGLQVKPDTYQSINLFSYSGGAVTTQVEGHELFEERFGGKVFIAKYSSSGVLDTSIKDKLDVEMKRLISLETGPHKD